MSCVLQRQIFEPLAWHPIYNNADPNGECGVICVRRHLFPSSIPTTFLQGMTMRLASNFLESFLMISNLQHAFLLEVSNILQCPSPRQYIATQSPPKHVEVGQSEGCSHNNDESEIVGRRKRHTDVRTAKGDLVQGVVD